MRKNIVFSLITLVTLSSCLDDPEPRGLYDIGAFVSNEGPFQSGSGTISFLDTDEGTVRNEIYQEANAGASLGNIVQSVNTLGDLTLAVVNNADKIVLFNTSDARKVSEVSGILQPRYSSFLDRETCLVSSWGPRISGVDGFLHLVDYKTGATVSSVQCGKGPEKLLQSQGEAYVCNSGGFGQDSTITIVRVDSMQVSGELIVGDNPQSITSASDGNLWVVCSGLFDFIDPSNNTPGGLYRINPGTREVTLIRDLPTGASDITTSSLSSSIYFLSSEGVNRYDLLTQDLSVIKPGSFYECGFDFRTNDLFVADAKDFNSRGEILQIDEISGETIATYEVGLIPGGFAFH